MQYVGRLVSSVYNNITPSINPATLSGAIDVIVVERQVEVDVDDEDEQDNQSRAIPDRSSDRKKMKKMVTELASTPFHVRFGKMSVLRPAERKVSDSDRHRDETWRVSVCSRVRSDDAKSAIEQNDNSLSSLILSGHSIKTGCASVADQLLLPDTHVSHKLPFLHPRFRLSSPFSSCDPSSSSQVTLHLNNSAEPLPFAMKVGEAGEAFFVLELDDSSYSNQSIPEDLVTSPILSAASSPTLSASQGQEGRDQDPVTVGHQADNENHVERDQGGGDRQKEDEDLEPLDLGAAESSGPSLTQGTGTDKAQVSSRAEDDKDEDARSGSTEVRSRSSRSRSQDTNVTTPTSGPDRGSSPPPIDHEDEASISKHSRHRGYDQHTSPPSKAQPLPPSNTADQTGPLSSLSNAASKASGVVSAAGRAIISPVVTVEHASERAKATTDGSKIPKLESMVNKQAGEWHEGDKAPVEEEDERMGSNWNSKSDANDLPKQDDDGGDKAQSQKGTIKPGKGEDQDVIERSEAEDLEFQMQKRALKLVKAEQEASSPKSSSSAPPADKSSSKKAQDAENTPDKDEDEERAPSSSLAQVEDNKSEKKDDDQPISNALLAEEPFPKPFGTGGIPDDESSRAGTNPVQPPTSRAKDSRSSSSRADEDEELRSYLKTNQNRNPISSLGVTDTETYPVSQPDHEKYLAGTLLGKESVEVGNGEKREVDKVMLDERIVRRRVERRQEINEQEEQSQEKREQSEEEKKLAKSPKVERREDLQYMLDIDGYKMTADGEDLAFAEGHRLANELPLSKKHGGAGKGKTAKHARYDDSAIADDEDQDLESVDVDSGKASGKSGTTRRTSFARTSRSGLLHGHRSSRSMSRSGTGRNGSSSLSRQEGTSARRDIKNSSSGSSAMGHHLQARLKTRRSSSSLLDDLSNELSSGDERPVLGLGANDEVGGTVEKESLSLSRDLARLARITRDHHHQNQNHQSRHHSSRKNNLSEGNVTPTSLIARRRTRSTKISGGPLGAGPRNRARNATHGGHFKEVSFSDTEAEVPSLRQKARKSRGRYQRNEISSLTLAKGKAKILALDGESSIPNTPSLTSFPKDDDQSFETDQTDDLADGERTPPAPPNSSMNDVDRSPQYEWGWGSLPKRKSQNEQDRRARVVSLGGSRAMRPDLDDDEENEVASYDAAASMTNNQERAADELSIDAMNKANEKPPNGKLRPDDSDPYLFRLELDDASHEFELSLCFDDTFGTPEEGTLENQDLAHDRDDYNFEENKISFQRFVDDQEVVDDERLVVRYNSRYLTWESASAVLATLSLYRKTLSAAETEGNGVSVSGAGMLDEDLSNQARPSVWSRWWNRKGVPTSASTSNLPIEPQEPDSGAKSSSPPAASPPHLLDRSRTDSVLETSNLDAGRAAGAAPSASKINNKVKADSKKTYAKTLRLTSDQLKSLNLKKGANTITFSVTSSYSGVATCTARIFFWESFHRVVVSDIDGTITKSDALGHVFTMMGRDWTHLGVAKLYTDIARNGYRIMYLTSRAIGQADSTRDYLKGIKQSNYQLPDGPVIMSPDRLMASLHREVILRKPEVFKMACLRDIARLFGADPRHAQAQPGGQWPGVSKESLQAANGVGAGGESSPAGGGATSGIPSSASPASKSSSGDSTPSASDPSPDTSAEPPQQPGQEQKSKPESDSDSSQQANSTPFYAGFGNRITDALSYRSVNIPSSRIFTIDSNGEVKMELLELAGYKSSYIHMTDLVDQMFPPITSRQELNPDKPEYNDFNFWRPSVVDIDLPADEDIISSPPVSPALSARSGRSMRSVRSNASLRSATSDGKDSSEYGHGRAQTENVESAPVSSSRLSRFGLGSLGLSRKSSAQTVANVPPASSRPTSSSSRPTSSSSTQSNSTSVFTFPTSPSPGSSYDQTAIPTSTSAPDLTDTWAAAAGGEDLASSSPPSSYGRGVTSWAAPWRRSRATSPTGTSISGAGSSQQHRQATSPLVGPVITAEPEEDEDVSALSDDDVSNFGGERDGNLDGKDTDQNEREGSEDMGDDVLEQDEDAEDDEFQDEEEEDEDPLLATGEIKFEWNR